MESGDEIFTHANSVPERRALSISTHSTGTSNELLIIQSSHSCSPVCRSIHTLMHPLACFSHPYQIVCQNDFITGSLAVKDAASVVTPINRLLGSGHFGTVVFSRDSHPRGHVSFASTHEGHKPFTTVHLPNPPSASGSNPCSVVTQELWPDHCVVGEPGWHFHPELHIHRADAIIDKGHAHDRDSYSAFYKEEDHHSHTMLGKALADRGVKEVYVVGLAYDYCVGSTAIDAARHGFEVGLSLKLFLKRTYLFMLTHATLLTRAVSMQKCDVELVCTSQCHAQERTTASPLPCLPL